MKELVRFAAAAAAIIAGVAWLLTVLFPDPVTGQAIWVSAAVALVVQVVSLIVARRLGREQMIVGWGAAVGLRFVTLVGYALVVAKLGVLPVTAALLSLAAFLFLTTLIEPLFLRT